jgi:Zn-dependent peptidase ImmA (M78 family)
MKIKTQIPIKGQVYETAYKWRLSHKGALCDGLTDPTNKIIWFDKQIDPEDKARVLIHEITHAILHETHIPESGGMSEEIEEMVCASVSTVLCELFDFKWKRAK